MTLYGPCVVCNRPLGEADYDARNVVAAIGPEGTVVMCADHLTEDGPHGPKYHAAVRAMAVAKIAQLRAEGNVRETAQPVICDGLDEEERPS